MNNMEICAKCRKPDLCERRGQCMDAAASEPAPLPFAVFDEFGKGADDRVQDHIHEALNAYRLASVHALGAKEQDEADAKLMATLSPITDATYLGLAEDIARLTAEGEKLKRFALAMLENWPLGDVDGGDLQEKAVEHGLLVSSRHTAPCREEGCNCEEYYTAEEWAEGVTCYKKAPWLFAEKSSTNEGPTC